jgi:hypothetical protein
MAPIPANELPACCAQQQTVATLRLPAALDLDQRVLDEPLSLRRVRRQAAGQGHQVTDVLGREGVETVRLGHGVSVSRSFAKPNLR